MLIKYRVRDKSGKAVAYEEIRYDKLSSGDRWFWCDANWLNLWTEGTYPHPGTREGFTGKTDKKGVEIYAGDELGHSGESLGKVFWSEKFLAWAVPDYITPERLADFSLALTPLDDIAVISEEGPDEQD